MEPYIEYIFVSENTIVDSYGRISAINIYNMINRTPTIVPMSVITKIYQVPAGEVSVKIKVFHPNGELFAEQELNGASPDDRILNIAANLGVREFTDKGKYPIKVFLNETIEVIPAHESFLEAI